MHVITRTRFGTSCRARCTRRERLFSLPLPSVRFSARPIQIHLASALALAPTFCITFKSRCITRISRFSQRSRTWRASLHKAASDQSFKSEAEETPRDYLGDFCSDKRRASPGRPAFLPPAGNKPPSSGDETNSLRRPLYRLYDGVFSRRGMRQEFLKAGEQCERLSRCSPWDSNGFRKSHASA